MQEKESNIRLLVSLGSPFGMMPSNDPRDRIVYLTHKLMIDSYIDNHQIPTLSVTTPTSSFCSPLQSWLFIHIFQAQFQSGNTGVGPHRGCLPLNHRGRGHRHFVDPPRCWFCLPLRWNVFLIQHILIVLRVFCWVLWVLCWVLWVFCWVMGLLKAPHTRWTKVPCFTWTHISGHKNTCDSFC